MKRLSIALAVALSTAAIFAAVPAPVTVGWSTLKTLTSVKTASPATALNNRQVSVPGFMVPLEDDADQVTEFLLVPYAARASTSHHPHLTR